jgi:hypothetical protein
MELGSMHVSTPDRWDRLWLINAFALSLLTLMGRRRRTTGLRSASQDQHDQAAHSSLFCQGYALRAHAEYDRSPPALRAE